MAKRGQRPYRRSTFFLSIDPYNPIENILAEIGNRAASLGIQRLSQDIARKLELSQMSAEDEINLNRARISLQRAEAELIKTRMLSKRQLQILDLQIEQKTMEMESRRHRLEEAQVQKTQLALPMATEVVSGALEVTADPEGLFGSAESEGYALWLDSLSGGKVILILGRRGSGKQPCRLKLESSPWPSTECQYTGLACLNRPEVYCHTGFLWHILRISVPWVVLSSSTRPVFIFCLWLSLPTRIGYCRRY